MDESRFSGNGSKEEINQTLYRLSTDFEFAMLARYYPVAYYIDLILPFFVYAFGFVGNSVSAALWFQRRLSRNNSSAFYLALILIVHLLFLVVHCIDYLDKVFVWHLAVRSYLYCEVVTYLLYFARYLSPLLVLGFVGERFIAVCYPLYRKVLCRTRTARTYAAVGGTVVALLSVAHPVFWTVDPVKGFCGYRTLPGLETAWSVFSPVTDVMFFVVLPLFVVVLDLIVVVKLCRIRNNAIRTKTNRTSMALQKLSGEKHGRRGGGGGGGGQEERDRGPKKEEEEMERPMPELAIRVPAQATTAFILTVSLYEALCLMAESTVYLLMASYPRGDPHLTEAEIVQDPTWIGFFRYSAAQCVVYGLTLTRHGCLTLLFLAIGAKFREAFCDLLRCRKSSPMATEVTKTTSVSSSTRSRLQFRV